jgi:hypothetical protein
MFKCGAGGTRGSQRASARNRVRIVIGSGAISSAKGIRALGGSNTEIGARRYLGDNRRSVAPPRVCIPDPPHHQGSLSSTRLTVGGLAAPLPRKSRLSAMEISVLVSANFCTSASAPDGEVSRVFSSSQNGTREGRSPSLSDT